MRDMDRGYQASGRLGHRGRMGHVRARMQQMALDDSAGRVADQPPVLAPQRRALAVFRRHLGQRLHVERQRDEVAVAARHFLAAEDLPEAVIRVGEMFFRIGIVGDVRFAADCHDLVHAECQRDALHGREAEEAGRVVRKDALECFEGGAGIDPAALVARNERDDGHVDAHHVPFEPAEGQAVQAFAVRDEGHGQVAFGIAARRHLELDHE
ncbi:conserved hypothetical protein, partial [Ricinus communis]